MSFKQLKSTLMLVTLAVFAVSSCGRSKSKSKDDEPNEAAATAAQGGSSSNSSSTGSIPYILTEASLPACNTANDRQMYYIADQAIFKTCLNGQYVTADLANSKGAKGDDGQPATALMVYDANKKVVGTHFRATAEDLILFTNGGIANINPANGQYVGSIGIDTSSGSTVFKACYFLSPNCGGTCYFTDAALSVVPQKNAVFYTGSRWFISDGSEANVGSQTYESVYMSGSCINASMSINYGRALTTEYFLPNNLTMPLASPLYFDTAAAVLQ